MATATAQANPLTSDISPPLPSSDIESQQSEPESNEPANKAKEKIEEMEISKTIDLVRSDPPIGPMISAICISFIQFMTFLSILYSTENGVDESQNQFFIIITLIFATIAITNAGIPLWVELMTGGISVVSNIFKCRIQFLKILIISFETTNFALLYVTAISVVPAQGTPLDIVLNCTALIIISELDDGYFQCFPCQAPVDQEYAKSAHKLEMTLSKMKKVMYVLGLIGNFFVIVAVYSVYYVNADSDDL
jgi:hypothetical protein